MMPAWAYHAIWYHLYPLGFLDAEKTNPEPGQPDGHIEHRLRRLEPWLDYIIEMGANGLLLGPVFESQTHGYDTVDYFRVDRRLGDEEDILWLIDACHQRGIRVMFDGVFNHVGRAFPAFVDVLQRRQESPSAHLFRIDFDQPGYDGFAYANFEGHGELVALNHANEAVIEMITEVATHWLARGVDGFRLDAAYAVPPDFWRVFSDRVRSRYPDALLLGEMIQGNYQQFIQQSNLDTLTQYELWKAIWSSLNDKNFFELAWALGRHQEFSQMFIPYTFIGNHDVTRIASQLNDPRHLAHALAILFTAPGMPSIYAGDEQGWRGVKHNRPGGDDEIRPPFPAQPSDLGPEGWPIYHLHQELIALRRRHAWMVDAEMKTLQLTNTQFAYQVTGRQQERLLVVLNIDDQPASIGLSWQGAGERPPKREAGQEVRIATRGDNLHLSQLPPHSWTVLGTS